ncbi:hypothetical protein HDU76_002880, partial [Blyttiomyces sp. JEL0837]
MTHIAMYKDNQEQADINIGNMQDHDRGLFLLSILEPTPCETPPPDYHTLQKAVQRTTKGYAAERRKLL